MVADQVGDGGVAAGDATGDRGRLRVVEAGTAVGDGLLDLQQVVAAQQLDLRAGCLVGVVALGGGRAQLGGDQVGALQRRRELRGVVVGVCRDGRGSGAVQPVVGVEGHVELLVT